MSNPLAESISKLYEVFERYKLDGAENVTCFDYGPSEENLAGIKMPLREIPLSVVALMEFYDYTWDSWGREIDVKYFLPRLCELIAHDSMALEDAGTFSFFKYKLTNCLVPQNCKWRDEERKAIHQFLRELFIVNFAICLDIQRFIECAIVVAMPIREVFEIWRSNKALTTNQLLELFRILGRPDELKTVEELRTFIDTRDLSPTYLENRAELKIFLHLALDFCAPALGN